MKFLDNRPHSFPEPLCQNFKNYESYVSKVYIFKLKLANLLRFEKKILHNWWSQFHFGTGRFLKLFDISCLLMYFWSYHDCGKYGRKKKLGKSIYHFRHGSFVNNNAKKKH